MVNVHSERRAFTDEIHVQPSLNQALIQGRRQTACNRRRNRLPSCCLVLVQMCL